METTSLDWLPVYVLCAVVGMWAFTGGVLIGRWHYRYTKKNLLKKMASKTRF
jgi:hypothetical protein